MSNNPHMAHGFWIFEDDFTSYADDAAMVTAGYTNNPSNINLDAANDELDFVGNGALHAGITLWGSVAIEDATLYSGEMTVVRWVMSPLQFRFTGGTVGGIFAINDTGTGTFRREDILSGLSNTELDLDSNAATDSSITRWAFTKTQHVPKA